VGYNTGWKRSANLGCKSTQNFYYIPYSKLIRFLKYKCEWEGINFKSDYEGHTSKCSALDFESIKHHCKYMSKRAPPIKGRNSKEEFQRKGKYL
jgi:putative transposase